MRTFCLLMIGAVSIARADTFGSASCTFGTYTQTETQTLPPGQAYIYPNCTLNTPNFGGLGASALAAESVSGTTATISGYTLVFAMFGQSSSTAWNAQANVSGSLTLATDGPKRAGYIQLNLQEGGGQNGPGPSSSSNFVISDDQYYYTSLPPANVTLPFQLGSGFQISISLASGFSGDYTQPSSIGTESSASEELTFSLLEADGTTAVPLFITPEPSTWVLLLFGLGLGFSANFLRGLRA